MRLGTTSYIYPADIITNVRKLAGRVDDVELLMLEVNDPVQDLPDKAVISELNLIALDNAMTYTVHLPLDLMLGEDHNRPSIDKALTVIRSTRALAPHGFVVHLQAPANGSKDRPEPWLKNFTAALEILGNEAGGIGRLCVENVENHRPELMDTILDQSAASCCVDVGHLWKQGIDPAGRLERWLPRVEIIHIHGVRGRDHQGLSKTPAGDLDRVISVMNGRYEGVLTFEVFNEGDFLDSIAAFRESVGRVSGCAPK